jgi:hypothetical protein
MEKNEVNASEEEMILEQLREQPSDDDLEAMVATDRLECKCQMTGMSRR